MGKNQNTNQLDNAGQSAPNSDEMVTTDNFFNSLDNAHSAGTPVDESGKADSSTKDYFDDTSQSKSTEDQLKLVTDRYSESSKEAKKMATELKEATLKIAELKGMVETLGSNISGKEETPPKNLIEELGLPEDFVFDGAELNDPSSDSSKYFFAINQLSARQAQDNAVQQIKREMTEKDFKNKYNYDEEKWNNFKDWANKKTLSFEDLHYLFNRGKRESTIANNAINDVILQREKMNGIGNSLFNVGSQGNSKKQGNNLAELLGIKEKTGYFK